MQILIQVSLSLFPLTRAAIFGLMSMEQKSPSCTSSCCRLPLQACRDETSNIIDAMHISKVQCKKDVTPVR